jgi:hypothetical protein
MQIQSGRTVPLTVLPSFPTKHPSLPPRPHNLSFNCKSVPLIYLVFFPVSDDRPFFTREPGELRGERLQAQLVKSTRGLGFTIVGGDDSEEEFLQIKSVVPNGPAWLDSRLKTGKQKISGSADPVEPDPIRSDPKQSFLLSSSLCFSNPNHLVCINLVSNLKSDDIRKFIIFSVKRVQKIRPGRH